jgi:hypothetical protein
VGDVEPSLESIRRRNVTPFVSGQSTARKLGYGAGSATIHISVNGMSFSLAMLRCPRPAGIGHRERANLQEELTMIDQERGFAVNDGKWNGWPNDIGKRAALVIATTRYAWLSGGSAPVAADEIDVESVGLLHPIFRRALDARSGRAGRTRILRARSARRA